jgi:lipopolysaccharide export system protein LptC
VASSEQSSLRDGGLPPEPGAGRALLRRGAPVALLLVILAGSAWLLNRLGDTTTPSRGFADFTLDLFMRDFEITTMNEQGRPEQRLSAAHMAHFPATGTKEFTSPRLTLYSSGGTPWRIASERGWTSAENDVLLLLGKVDIWRNDGAGEREIHIETSDLRVLPESRFGETEMPVVISTPQSRTEGKGMRAYLDESRLELLSEVRTIVDPSRD